MKPELQKQIVEKFPKIFKMVGSTPQESCMAWGLAVGDGWYKLIHELCRDLQHNTDDNNQPQVVAAQVKEKFGGLRFYVNSATDKQYGAIDFAETLSYSICECCGSMKDVGQTRGWIVTLCQECATKENKKLVKDENGGASYYTEFPDQEKEDEN